MIVKEANKIGLVDNNSLRLVTLIPDIGTASHFICILQEIVEEFENEALVFLVVLLCYCATSSTYIFCVMRCCCGTSGVS